MIHKDLEFHVDRPDGTTLITRRFDEAAALALVLAVSHGKAVNLDVIAWSRAAARAYAGDEGAESYDEDPEASVFERVEVTANYVGRVP
jgi:hypothetical protein